MTTLTGLSNPDDDKNTDNQTLSRTTQPRKVENREYAGMLKRCLKAYAVRVSEGDIEALAEIDDLKKHLDTALVEAVEGLREMGFTWGEIGARVGITKQAARLRWAKEPGAVENFRPSDQDTLPGMGLS